MTAALSTIAMAALLISATAGISPWPSTLGVLALVPAAAVDVVNHRLPDRLVGGAAVVFVVAAVTERFVVGPAATSSGVSDLAFGAASMAGPLLLLHLISPSAMGFGDVKTAVVLGAALGAVDPLLAWSALALAAGSAATFGVLTRRRTLPFGPALVGGAAVVLLVHPLFLPVQVVS